MMLKIVDHRNLENCTVRIGYFDGIHLDPPKSGVYFERTPRDSSWHAVIKKSDGHIERIDTYVTEISGTFQVFKSNPHFALNGHAFLPFWLFTPDPALSNMAEGSHIIPKKDEIAYMDYELETDATWAFNNNSPGSDKGSEGSLSRSLPSNDPVAQAPAVKSESGANLAKPERPGLLKEIVSGNAEQLLFQTDRDLKARLGALVGGPIDTRKRR